MKVKYWMTPKSETKIVALLLLFFLAHVAFSECSFPDVPVKYKCGLTSPKLEKQLNWGSDNNICVRGFFWDKGLFEYKHAQALHETDSQLTPFLDYHQNAELAKYSNKTRAGDLLVGIKLKRKSIAVPFSRGAFNTQESATIFINRAANVGTFSTDYEGQQIGSVEPITIIGPSGSGTISLSDGTTVSCAYEIPDDTGT